MKTIVLIQHCQSQHHVNRQIQLSDSENGLTDLGRRQAGCVAARLATAIGSQSCRLYSSDQVRAWQTAEIIGERLSLPMVAVPGLREGCAERPPHLPPVVEIPRPGDRMWLLFDSRPGPDLETWREFHCRVCQAMDQIACELSADCLPIVVTHGGTLSNIIAWWLRLSLDVLPERTPFAATPGSISVLRANRFGNPVLERLNDAAHLQAAGVGGQINLGA